MRNVTLTVARTLFLPHILHTVLDELPPIFPCVISERASNLHSQPSEALHDTRGVVPCQCKRGAFPSTTSGYVKIELLVRCGFVIVKEERCVFVLTEHKCGR